MTEQSKAGMYLAHLEDILAGKKDPGAVEDREVQELLQLAKTMLTAGLGQNSKIREKLRQQLLSKPAEENNFSLPMPKDELDDEALDYVIAAGLTGKVLEEEERCPFCGFARKSLGGKCPVCSR